MHKIKALVKMNDGIAVVLEEPSIKKNYKVGSSIVSTDGLLGSCLYYDRPSPGFFAFAGRKFDVLLENGEVINCYGQYWDGITKEAKSMLGEDLIRVTAQDIATLTACYVFCGHVASRKAWDEFLSTYNGKVYGYWEYEALIKGKKPWINDAVDFRIWKNHRRFKNKFLINK